MFPELRRHQAAPKVNFMHSDDQNFQEFFPAAWLKQRGARLHHQQRDLFTQQRKQNCSTRLVRTKLRKREISIETLSINAPEIHFEILSPRTHRPTIFISPSR